MALPGQARRLVLIQVAEPVAFFGLIDETNERWEERAFTNPHCPPFMEILEGLKAMVCRHNQTTFIGAHVGCYGETLGWVAGMLEASSCLVMCIRSLFSDDDAVSPCLLGSIKGFIHARD